MNKKIDNTRFYIFFILIAVLAGCILVRLFGLQVSRHNFYTALAKNQHEFLEKLIPRRGEIFVQEKNDVWHPIALDRTYQTVFLAPNEVTNAQEVADKLSLPLDIPKEKILEKLNDPSDPYEPLKSQLSDEVADQIKAMNLPGVHFIGEDSRWYPQGSLAANLLGFVGFSNDQKIGQYGLEQYYENELAGKSGVLQSEKDALGRWLLVGDYSLDPAQDGSDIYLTIDQNIQYIAEQKLKGAIEKWNAAGGCAIVMDPQSGAIRAMASFPNYDPNEYQKVERIDNFVNTCVSRAYEPGSVFKPVIMSAGLDSGKITPETTYIDTGSVAIGGYTIQNAQQKTYGLSTMTNVLEKSINTGVIFVERLIGGETFKKYAEAFGFGNPLGIDLAGEAVGNLKNLEGNKEINLATVAFGQGISVTSLQMTSAIAAIANEGRLMRPYIVEKTVTAGGEEKKTEPQLIRQVIAPQTAAKLTAMLVSTVRNGYDKIKIKDYFVAGKTGTAQVPNEDARGYSDETIHSFAGYAPAYNPKFLIFLKLEKPRGIQFASESLAPVFGDLTQYLLNYYQIPPEG